MTVVFRTRCGCERKEERELPRPFPERIDVPITQLFWERPVFRGADDLSRMPEFRKRTFKLTDQYHGPFGNVVTYFEEWS